MPLLRGRIHARRRRRLTVCVAICRERSLTVLKNRRKVGKSFTSSSRVDSGNDRVGIYEKSSESAGKCY